MTRFFRPALYIGLLLLGACSKNIETMTADEDAAQLYKRAYEAANLANFESAIKFLQILESRYPFSDYALQAQLDLAYTYYMFGRNEEAVSEADRFIRFNPTHPNVDYAYYIKGLANFGQRKQLFGSWFPKDPSDYDQKPLRDAFQNFAELLYRFPGSQYAKDARQRMVYLRNVFGESEIKVARFYLKKKAWVAAVNRANYILENFSETPAGEEALSILVRSYTELDMPDAAADAQKTLQLNFPARTAKK